MRIIAGAAKGRRLDVPRGSDVRPTGDRVKEAMFSTLQPLVVGTRVLDLFAGTGALGLEALSRGAISATFVERARPALSTIQRNITSVGLPGTEVVAKDVTVALRGDLPSSPFGLVVADPPYHYPNAQIEQLLMLLLPHLGSGATVVLERTARDGAPPWPSEFRSNDPRRYGDTAIHRARLIDG